MALVGTDASSQGEIFMNPVVSSIMQIIEKESLPQNDVSSHWKLLGDKTIVAHDNQKIVLKGVGFGNLEKGKFHRQWTNYLLRLSYSPVYSKLEFFSLVWKQMKSLANDLSIGL